MRFNYFASIILVTFTLTLLGASVALYNEAKTLSVQVEKLRTNQNKITIRLNTLEQRCDNWAPYWGKLYPQR